MAAIDIDVAADLAMIGKIFQCGLGHRIDGEWSGQVLNIKRIRGVWIHPQDLLMRRQGYLRLSFG